MSQRLPGYSQPDMIALWKGFVQKSFRKTNFRTTFNGATRNVYQDGVRLVVLDEYHGDLEVLAMQSHPGEGKHIGSQEIEIACEPPQLANKPIVKELKLGRFHPGSKHKFILVGWL